jgi:hypothetical protein
MKKLLLSMVALAALSVTSCSGDDDNSKDRDEVVVINPANFTGSLEAGQRAELDPAQTYMLTGPFVVKADAELRIPAGTVIKASGGTSAYIAVAQDGQIFIEGEANNPVIMTSSKATPAQGDWGGLVICGRANTNKGGSNGQTATAEVSDLTYGGTKNNDNSGVIRYLRIEYTGATFNSSKEFNGLSLFGVGSGTKVEYVQSYEGGDDGIEFFGGSVNGKYLVATNSGDDSIDFADGWSGTGEYWYISGGAKAGIEGSNNGENGAATPTTTATLKNITVIGPGTEGGLFVKEGGGNWNVDNIYISGFATGIHVGSVDSDPVSNQNITSGKIKFTNVQFNGVTNNTDYTGTAEFFTTGTATGAGNGAAAPAWTQGWTRGLVD